MSVRPADAASSTNLNFQARLSSATGNVVPDGNYSIEFKLYNVSSGGSAEWAETQPTVRVVNGYLTVSLGSATAFPSTIDWSQEHWLTMNVNGDGEMNPRLKLTAVPYAFRAGQADALRDGSNSITASDLVQKTPVSLQEFNSLVAGIRLKQTGSGGLLQLQGASGDVFTVSNTGAVSAAGALTISAGGASITGGLNNNAGHITGAGNITGVGTNITALAGLTIASGGSGDLILDAASNKIVIGATDTTLQRNAAGTYTIDLNNAGTTTLALSNSDVTNAANLNLVDGNLLVASIQVLTNGRALENLTGISGSGALAMLGGTIDLNVSSNNATNINTGSSTGTISIGGGSAPLVIDSTNFDVSSLGGLSGITGYAQASGNFAMSGNGTFGTGSGLVSLNGATNISTSTASTVALTVNGTSGTAATALNIVQAGDAANLTLSNIARTSGALFSLTHSTSAYTGTGLLVNMASGSGNFASGNFADFQVNAVSKFRVDNTGALEIKTDGTAALTIKTSGGAALFTVDTSNSIVSIGSGGRLQLTGVAGDPASLVDGDLWYSTTQKSFRSKTAAGTVGLSGLLYTNTTIPAGNTWSNTTAENNFASNYSLPANSLIPGKVVKITARGSYGTTSVTGGNMNIRLKFGSTVLVATGGQVLTAGLNSNTGWQAEFTVTGVSTTTAEAQGRATYSNGSISTANTALVTLDTTLDHTIQLSEQWSSASNSNTITLRQLIIEVLN